MLHLDGYNTLVISRVSLHHIVPRNGRLLDVAADDFDAIRYSRFKYGDAAAAEHYATRLTARIAAVDGISGADPAPVVTTAPFKYLPTASFELAERIRRQLAEDRRGPGADAVQLVPIHLTHVDAGNYSARDVGTRQRILEEAGLRLGAGDVAGRPVILVDDAVVSGTAEATAVALLKRAGAGTVLGAYVVEVDKEYGRLQPELEDQLNHAFVEDLDSLLDIFADRSAVLNIRTVKYVLGWPRSNDIERFFTKISDAHLVTFADAVRQTGKLFADSYPGSVQLLCAAVRQRGLE